MGSSRVDLVVARSVKTPSRWPGFSEFSRMSPGTLKPQIPVTKHHSWAKLQGSFSTSQLPKDWSLRPDTARAASLAAGQFEGCGTFRFCFFFRGTRFTDRI